MQLHCWDDEAHPNLVNRDAAKSGHGVLIWFHVDDFDDAVARAKAVDATVLQGPLTNPHSKLSEL